MLNVIVIILCGYAYTIRCGCLIGISVSMLGTRLSIVSHSVGCVVRVSVRVRIGVRVVVPLPLPHPSLNVSYAFIK